MVSPDRSPAVASERYSEEDHQGRKVDQENQVGPERETEEGRGGHEQAMAENG
jgi:hypothetical protein